MGHNVSEEAIRRRILANDPEFFRRIDAAREYDLREAMKIVHIFNARVELKQKVLLIPTVEAAILAGHPWLHVVCRRCDCVGSIDLSFRKSNRNLPVTAVVPRYDCSMCEGRHPVPRVLRLSPHHEPGRGPVDRDRRPNWSR